jgi:hypothetical protein
MEHPIYIYIYIYIYIFSFWGNDKFKIVNVTLNHMCMQSYDRCKKSFGLQITNHVVHFKFGNMKKQQSPCNVVWASLVQIVKWSRTSNSNYPWQSYLKPQTLDMFSNLAHTLVVSLLNVFFLGVGGEGWSFLFLFMVISLVRNIILQMMKLYEGFKE